MFHSCWAWHMTGFGQWGVGCHGSVTLSGASTSTVFPLTMKISWFWQLLIHGKIAELDSVPSLTSRPKKPHLHKPRLIHRYPSMKEMLAFVCYQNLKSCCVVVLIAVRYEDLESSSNESYVSSYWTIYKLRSVWPLIVFAKPSIKSWPNTLHICILPILMYEQSCIRVWLFIMGV